MFSFKYAIFCMLAGLLAGYSFDKKNDMVWVGIFTYLIIFSGFYVNFPYDSSWAFVASIEVLAGHGLYKMGFGNFLGRLFSSPELYEEPHIVIKTSKTSKPVKTVDITRETTRTVVSSKPLSKGETIKKTSVMLAKKGAYKVNEDYFDISQAYVVESDEVRNRENVCAKKLSNKGYDVWKTRKGYIVYIKPIIMGVIQDRVSNVDELCELAENYNQIDY